MSCGCTKPEKAALWTPIPEYRQPTDIQPGENIDCYMKRAGNPTGLMDNNEAMAPDRIDNTSLTSDLLLVVNTTMKLTEGSTRTPTWSMEIKENGAVISIPGMSINPSSGLISCTIPQAYADRNFKVLITANDSAGEIDSREFNFFPKQASKDGTIKFVMPLDGDIHVTCKFGPRTPPAAGASSNHKGMDFARKDHSLGNILAAADGTIVRCGPGSGWGNVIFIEHNDAQGRLVATTVYGHWSQAYVAQGQKVAAGQKIAKEGNVGIGSGAHLHFEMHKGKFGNPTDPAPYLNGAAIVNDAGSSTSTSIANSNVGMSAGEASANNDCPGSTSGGPLPNQALPDNSGQPSPDVAVPADKAAVAAEILRACQDHGPYTEGSEEHKFLLSLAKIESGFNPTAKNPTSSALGLYQMLDSIAAKYFGLIGLPPTFANRTDPYKSTWAMIKFYQNEFVKYWAEYKSHGTLANKAIQTTSWSAQYPNFNKNEFLYGLIHHDGVGTAVSGIDKGGVAYWRKTA